MPRLSHQLSAVIIARRSICVDRLVGGGSAVPTEVTTMKAVSQFRSRQTRIDAVVDAAACLCPTTQWWAQWSSLFCSLSANDTCTSSIGGRPRRSYHRLHTLFAVSRDFLLLFFSSGVDIVCCWRETIYLLRS